MADTKVDSKGIVCYVKLFLKACRRLHECATERYEQKAKEVAKRLKETKDKNEKKKRKKAKEVAKRKKEMNSKNGKKKRKPTGESGTGSKKPTKKRKGPDGSAVSIPNT